MKQNSGFTLLELLIAAVIMLILLGALGGMFSGSTRAYEAQSDAQDSRLAATTAIDQMAYEFSIAGFKGSDSADYTTNTITLGTEDALQIAVNASQSQPDTITVRYFENHQFGTTPQQAVTERRTKRQFSFSLNTTTKTLNRTDLTMGTTTPVALGVSNFKVVSMTKDGTVYNCPNPQPTTSLTPAPVTQCPLVFDKAKLRGFTLRLTMMDGAIVNRSVTLNNKL